MDQAQLIRAFAATVQASLLGLRDLLPALEQERAALSGRDPAAIEAAATDKLRLLRELEPGLVARDRLQGSVGLPPGIPGGQQLVERLGDDALRADWAELTGLARQVAQLNDQNAQLTLQGQRATRTALGILTGRSADDDTYAGLRRRSSGLASYALGKA